MNSSLTRGTQLLGLLAIMLSNGCSRSEATAASPVAGAATPAFGQPGDRDAGKRIFLRVCFVCHQPTGLGVPGVFPPLAGSPIAADRDPGIIIRIVLFGLQGPIEVRGATYNNVMPAHASQLNDDEIAAVLTYVRSAWGNGATPVTAEAVKQVRANVRRTGPWTWAELNRS